MFISYMDPAFRYTGRWSRLPDDDRVIVTTAPGAYFELAFTGELVTLQFDTAQNCAPYPHLWVSVDGAARVETVLAPYLNVQAPDSGVHTLTVIFKSAVETHHRWHKPLVEKVSLIGAQAAGTAALPPDNRKVIEFVGDSITEGILVDEDRVTDRIYLNESLNRVFQDDACASYAWRTAEILNLRPIIMGYGAVGMTKGGSGGVPRAAEAYPYCFADCPISFDEPDYIVINHGANDRFASPQEYIQQYRACLDTIRKLHPHAQIIVVSCYWNLFVRELEDMVAQYNRQNSDSVLFLDASSWTDGAITHPPRCDHENIAKQLSSALKDIVST